MNKNIKPADRADRLMMVFPEVFRRLFQGVHHAHPELPPAQTKVLHTLGHKGPLKMGELSNFLGVEMSTMTVAVDALVAAGLVERQRGKADRRIVQVQLTRKGQQLFKKLKAQLKANLTALFCKMPDQEQEKVVGAFEQLCRIFREIKA